MKINRSKRAICAALLLGTAVTASASTLVTFQVDMTQAVTDAVFDPNTQTVEVRGNFEGWGAAPFALTNNPTGPSRTCGLAPPTCPRTES